jgi:uncharacterized protein
MITLHMASDDQEYSIDIGLDEPDDMAALVARVADQLGVAATTLPPLTIRKRAVDARRGNVRFHLTLGAVETDGIALGGIVPREVAGSPVLIIGGGPAGLFCAYQLARDGIASIVIERGKKVQARRHDLKGLTRHGIVNQDSNYCFGEGGAGTYSDGKLYTRSHKRGDVRDVIELLALHGAPAIILEDARPHIGSNKLPKVITAMRERLENCGVQFRFESKVTGFIVEHGAVRGVTLANGESLQGRAVVVAAGHSARDMLTALDECGATLQAKPFAMGVRIEHPQALIDAAQYGKFAGHPKLRAAPYRLAFTPSDGRGAFSFCMCPGGWIVPATTEADGLVVNGMSLSRRDSPFANSGLVVGVEIADSERQQLASPLGGIELQRRIERAAMIAGGGMLRAPATRVTDFVAGRASTTVPATSYEPGLTASDIAAVLDASGVPLAKRLREAIPIFDRQLRGYNSNEAVLVGVESRTSSPVRVVRDHTTLQSPTVKQLYPCGEGAGYAGGIVSAAMDGIRIARAIAQIEM